MKSLLSSLLASDLLLYSSKRCDVSHRSALKMVSGFLGFCFSGVTLAMVSFRIVSPSVLQRLEDCINRADGEAMLDANDLDDNVVTVAAGNAAGIEVTACFKRLGVP